MVKTVRALALAAGLAWTAGGWADCPRFDGALEQGGFIWGRVPPGSRVTLDGRNNFV